MRKAGTATFVGTIALIINLVFRPTALHLFGFFVASIAFDGLVLLLGYKRVFEKKLLGSIGFFAVSVFSAAVAGLIIASFFMAPVALVGWGGVWDGQDYMPSAEQ